MGVIFAVIGGILKWILFVLLGLIGLLLVLLLIFITASVRYRLQGEKSQDRLQGQVRLSWLFHLLRFRLEYRDQQMVWSLKIGPKQIASSEPSPRPKRRKKAAKPQTQTAEEPAQTETEEMRPELPPEKGKLSAPEAATLSSTRPEALGLSSDRREPAENQKIPAEIPALPEKQKKTWRETVTRICWKIRRFFEALIHPFQSLYRAACRAGKKWETLQNRWERYPQKQETAQAALKLIKGLLRPLLPRAYKMELLFGLGDPAATGRVMEYYYMLWPLLFPKAERRKKLTIDADYQDSVFEFKGWCQGRFCLGSFIVPAVKALLDPNIRRLIRYIRSHQS